MVSVLFCYGVTTGLTFFCENYSAPTMQLSLHLPRNWPPTRARSGVCAREGTLAWCVAARVCSATDGCVGVRACADAERCGGADKPGKCARASSTARAVGVWRGIPWAGAARARADAGEQAVVWDATDGGDCHAQQRQYQHCERKCETAEPKTITYEREHAERTRVFRK